MNRPADSGQRRTLASVVARHAAQVRSRSALLKGLGKALLLTMLAALAAAPLAAVWAISSCSRSRTTSGPIG